MERNPGAPDLFCRINVQTDMPHHELVAILAHALGGTSHGNVVKNRLLNISVDDNDVFDPEKSHTGKDRWLHFRYTLEVDPVKGISPAEYVAAIGALLERFWASCM